MNTSITPFFKFRAPYLNESAPVGRIFSDLFSDLSNFADFSARIPAKFWKDQEDCWVLVVDVPGFSKEDLKISTQNGQILISGESGIVSGRSISQVYSLPLGVDLDNVEAKLELGVLEIRIPKKDLAKEITISV